MSESSGEGATQQDIHTPSAFAEKNTNQPDSKKIHYFWDGVAALTSGIAAFKVAQADQLRSIGVKDLEQELSDVAKWSNLYIPLNHEAMEVRWAAQARGEEIFAAMELKEGNKLFVLGVAVAAALLVNHTLNTLHKKDDMPDNTVNAETITYEETHVSPSGKIEMSK